MNLRSFFPCWGMLALATGCGDLHPLGPASPQEQAMAPAQNITINFVPEPETTPMRGMVEGAPFQIKSIVFAQGTNADAHQELQVAVSDIANYCNLLTSGAQADGFVARLRTVNMGTGGQSLPVDPNNYSESAMPTWTGYVSDIPPPGAQAGATATAPLVQGRYMTGGFVRLKARCAEQQLNPAFVGSSVRLDAVDATGARGRAILWFSDGVGTTTGFALSGSFTATPCPALANDIARTPFVAFAPPSQCASE